MGSLRGDDSERCQNVETCPCKERSHTIGNAERLLRQTSLEKFGDLGRGTLLAEEDLAEAEHRLSSAFVGM